jgi:hypothetical protein
MLDAFGLGPSNEAAKERGVSSLSMGGLAAFVAQMLQEILDEILHS